MSDCMNMVLLLLVTLSLSLFFTVSDQAGSRTTSSLDFRFSDAHFPQDYITVNNCWTTGERWLNESRRAAAIDNLTVGKLNCSKFKSYSSNCYNMKLTFNHHDAETGQQDWICVCVRLFTLETSLHSCSKTCTLDFNAHQNLDPICPQLLLSESFTLFSVKRLILK